MKYKITFAKLLSPPWKWEHKETIHVCGYLSCVKVAQSMHWKIKYYDSVCLEI